MVSISCLACSIRPLAGLILFWILVFTGSLINKIHRLQGFLKCVVLMEMKHRAKLTLDRISHVGLDVPFGVLNRNKGPVLSLLILAQYTEIYVR